MLKMSLNMQRNGKSSPSKKKGLRKKKTLNVSPTTTAANETVSIDYQLLQTVSKEVQLRDILLGDVAFTSIADPKSLRSKDAPKISFSLELVAGTWWNDQQKLDVRLSYLLVAHVDGQTRQELFRMQISWIARYELKVAYDGAVSAMEDFVEANVQINVFPYLRQIVNDVSARAGWPPLLLPVFRVPAKRPVGRVQKLPVWHQM